MLSAASAPVAAAPTADRGDGSATVAGSAATPPPQQTLATSQQSRPTAQPTRAPRTTFAIVGNEIAGISTNYTGRQSHLDRAEDEFDTAAATYRNPVDARKQSFFAAAQGTRALRAFVSSGNDPLTDEKRASIERSSSLAVQATNTTVRWHLQTARLRLAAHGSNISDGTQRSLESSITNAERAYKRAERVRGRISPDNRLTRTLNQRARAITQYRTGWSQAQTVLDRLDPVNRPDADGDGIPDTREQRLGTNATLADSDVDRIDDGRETADGYPIDTDGDATIDALDGDSDGDSLPDLAESTNDTDGDQVANFRDSDDDGDTIPTRTEGTDSVAPTGDRDFDTRPNWLDTDADGDTIPDSTEGRIDHDGDGDPAYLDGDLDEDGLIDRYERNVTDTDPANNDSDAPSTAVDEAGNGVIDGLEDFDNDTLSTFREYTYDTDPFVADTDGDGLPDGVESRNAQFDPLVSDTDGDGVSDGAGDRDNDTLDNAAEVDAGTSLGRNDTDGDSLLDPAELANDTDPLASDTDDDGLPDVEERAVPANPTVPDTDGDGVLDGNETFETIVRNDTYGVTVSFMGRGDIASTFSIRNGTNQLLTGEELDESIVSTPLHVETERAFERANVTLGYDESAVDEANATLALARYNETSQTIELLNSTVDTANDTVTGETSQFSWVMTVDVTEYVTQFETDPLDGYSSSEFVLKDEFDDGQLAPWACHNEPRSAGYDGTPTQGYCRETDGNVTVVEHTNRARTLNRTIALPADATNLTLRTKLDAVVRSRWSGSEVGLVLSNDSTKKTIYKLHNKGSSAYRSDSAEVAIDISNFAGEAVTIEFTSDGRHTYRGSNTASKIRVDYITIQANRTGIDQPVTDIDGDGLSDAVERGFDVGTGETLETDLRDPDTDGDGLQDGTEVGTLVRDASQRVWIGGEIRRVTSDYWTLNSNPTVFDTDGDGLGDGTEVDGWEIGVATDPETARAFVEAERANKSNSMDILDQTSVASSPLRKDTDDDDLPDGFETSRGLDASTVDTDGDTIADDLELTKQWYPTLHDYQPPRMFGSVDATGDRVNYQVNVTASDQSGVRRVKIYKRGERHYSWPADGKREVPKHSFVFPLDRNIGDKFLTGVSGYMHPSSAKVVVADIHGNSVTSKVYGPNNLGKIGGGFARTGWLPDEAQTVGVFTFSGLSGLSQGLNTLKNDLITAGYTLAQPWKYPEAVQKTVHGLQQTAALAASSKKRNRAFSALIQTFGDRRRQLNPLENSKYSDAFAMGYTVGYGTSFIIPIAAEAKLAQFAGRVPYLAAAVQASSAVRSSIKGALMGRALSTGTRIARLAPDGLKVDLDKINVRRGDGDTLDPDEADIGLGGRERLLISRTAEALQDTSLPAQNRLTDILSTENGREVVAWMSKRIRRDDGSRLKRGLDYIQRTGADGRDLLADLSDTASDRLTRLDPGLQRRVTDAADSMRTERVEDFLDWHAGLGSRAKDAVDDAVRQSGQRVVTFLGRTDADTRDALVTDGGDALDDVARAIDEVEPDRVEAFLNDAPDAGSHLLDKLDVGNDRRLLTLYEVGEFDDDNLRRLNELMDAGEMDQADTERLFEILETKESDSMIGGQIKTNDLLDISGQSGDLSEVRVIISASDETPGLESDVVWLENGIPGNDGTGWQHIVDKHSDDFANRYDSIDSPRDIQVAIKDAIENPDRTTITSDGKARFVYTPEDGEGPMHVIVGSNGFVQTAHPIN